MKTLAPTSQTSRACRPAPSRVAPFTSRRKALTVRASAAAPQGSQQTASRREALQLGVASLVSLMGMGAAAPERAVAGEASDRLRPNSETDNATNAYIQELLRRTEEKREERRVQRLNDYYKRNFKEYFEYESGSPSLAARRGIKPETTAKIQKWLEENQ